MNDPITPVTEDELHAFVDGELPEDRRPAVESWLATHPEDAARIAAWRSIGAAIQSRYAPVADEPVPERLTLERLAAPGRKWMTAAIAASVAAFLAGGGIGWFAHGVAGPSLGDRALAADALDAHKLYVVEVRHPVEVAAADRTHLVQWLSKRLGYEVQAPDLDAVGLKLVGGRLLPGPDGPAAFLMYEAASGERFTLYCARSRAREASMRFVTDKREAALAWSDGGIGYVVAGPDNREKLQQVAGLVYDQVDRPPH